jgi:hypothetical protein
MKKTGIPKLNVQLAVLVCKLIGDGFEELPWNRRYAIDYLHAAKHHLRIPIENGLDDDFFTDIEIEYNESDYAEMEMAHRLGWFWNDDQDSPRVPSAVPGALTGFVIPKIKPFQCSFGTWYQHFTPVERPIMEFSSVDDDAPKCDEPRPNCRGTLIDLDSSCGE